MFINPPPKGPTPSGYVYYLTNPQGGDPVSYDDCKWTNGILFEIKGESYANLSRYLPGEIADKFIDQGTREMAASSGRPVVWIFAEEKAAQFARNLFDKTPGLEGITVAYVRWARSGRQ
jgi:hypothetical protein